ncbi:hypothetical protein [Plasticicumulans sp.]|uniref:BufA2 family periplasmic bufferin-type metallophore n=1 Tax=Plasticicumulans sp. TaxID=2307179 RepID=UPI002C6EB612|nr:hypothetical protein [Plasticicumulans sp.]HNK32061.1 hypothetical protein [Plasticicumulans sp.]HNM44245.1 hypothetical protein [Plasticicumulans sp.]
MSTTTNVRTGYALAAAAAALFAGGLIAPTLASAADGEVKCLGANACKGQSACAGEHNSCKGQNACKGQGWINTASAQECSSKGGKPIL